MTENVVQQPDGTKKGSRNVWIGVGIAGGALIICLCVVAILFVVFDPWGIVARLTGRYDPIAQAAPPDTQFFVNANLLQLQSEEFIGLINTFSQATGGEEIVDFQDFIEKIDETVEPETDMTFSEDVQPWIGQFAGIGIKDVESDDFLDSSADFYLIVEVRNKKKADQFLADAMQLIQEENDQQFIEQTYKGKTISELDTDRENERVALCRSGGLVIVANNAETIMKVIDAQKGESLAELDQYQTLISELPKERLLTFYLDPSLMETLYQDLDFPTDLEENMKMDATDGFSMALSVTNIGIQMDMLLSYDLESLAEDQRVLLQETLSESQTTAFFPERTYLYFRSMHLDQMLTSFQEGLYGGVEEAEIEEAMGMFTELFGFNPQTDLFPYLDGEWALGLLDSSQGLFAEQLGIPIGLLLVVESSDSSVLLDTSQKIAQGMQDTGDFEVSQTESNGIKIFEIQDTFMQDTLLVYGVKDRFLFISTDVETIENTYGDRLSLAQNRRYVNGLDAFPSDMQPSVYLDVEGIAHLLTDNFPEYSQLDTQETAFINPIKTIEIGTRNIKEDLYHALMIVFIEGINGE